MVNVVGRGTPAQIAGVQVGDIIINVAGQDIATREQLAEALLVTNPGDETEITLLRGDDLTEMQLVAVLTEHPLDLVRLAKDGGTDQVPGNLSRSSCLMTLSQVNRKSIEPDQRNITGLVNPMELNWTVESDLSSTSGSSLSTVELSLELSSREMAAIDGDALRLSVATH